MLKQRKKWMEILLLFENIYLRNILQGKLADTPQDQQHEDERVHMLDSCLDQHRHMFHRIRDMASRHHLDLENFGVDNGLHRS